VTTIARQQVETLLGLAGIAPSPEEVDLLVASFPDQRARLERLWTVDVGETPPSLVFRAGEPTGAVRSDG
jgi:hypothetical protein